MTTVLIVLAVLIAGLAAYIATRPDAFRVERSTPIAAPPEAIFPYIDDLRRFGEWSPYEKLDPQMRRTFGGAARGVGATYAWEGNQKVGKGAMTITTSEPARRVLMDLAFERPFRANNIAEFTLTPEAGGTRMTWAMNGRHVFFTKAMGLVMNMDRMVGGAFEEGLANLKRLAEGEARG